MSNLSATYVCYYCDRTIDMGEMIVKNDIHYVCTRRDVKMCQEIREHNAERKRYYDFMEAQALLKADGATLVHCHCGLSFYTNFPNKTDPPCGICPHCGDAHSKEDTEA